MIDRCYIYFIFIHACGRTALAIPSGLRENISENIPNIAMPKLTKRHIDALPACQRRLKIRPKGGAKDCHLGWWSDLGVRL